MSAEAVFEFLEQLWSSGADRRQVRRAERLLAATRVALCQRVAAYDRGLAGFAALVERGKVRSLALERERETLRSQFQRRIAARQPAAAAHIERQLEENARMRAAHTAELGKHEALHQSLLRARSAGLAAARDELAALQRGLGELRTRAALSELNELTAAMPIGFAVSKAAQDRFDDSRAGMAARGSDEPGYGEPAHGSRRGRP